MKSQEFIHRKIDHLHYALQEESQASLCAEWEKLNLIHDSLPDLNLDELRINTQFLNQDLATPFFIAGMTAGHPDAQQINLTLAKLCSERGWLFGLGSQRRELDPHFSDHPSRDLKKNYPKLKMISNLGITQLIEVHEKKEWNRLFDIVGLSGSDLIAIHLNPIQEAIQKEGTPRFRGGLAALDALALKSKIPWMLKETGSGMSLSFLNRIRFLEPFAIDVSGLGGTHWGRIEGLRAKDDSVAYGLGQTFKNWGVSTIASIQNAKKVFAGTATEIWASGGVRSGLDAAKCIALGAKRVGFAKPALEACLQGEASLRSWMEVAEAELRTALFCTNSETVVALNSSKISVTNLAPSLRET